MRLRPRRLLVGALGRERRRARLLSTTAAPEPRRAASVTVVAAGVAVTGAAIANLAAWDGDAGTLAGVLALLVAATLVERFPLPLEGGDRGVTLTLVFGLAALVLFGWAAGTLVFFVATALAHATDARTRARAGRRASVAAVAAAGAGTAVAAAGGLGAGDVALDVAVAALAYSAVGGALAWLGPGFARPVRRLGRAAAVGALPLVFTASGALVLVVLWERSPVYSLALAGPLAALVLYGRSTHDAIAAMRLALTDPLTGLGNRRHFQERLQRELVAAEDRRLPLSLCLLDVDDFKRVNDELGHVGGDEVLVDVASRLRGGGEAFRLGGDEFALLLPGLDARAGLAAAEAVRRRVRGVRAAGDRVTASIGVATFPVAAAADVVREADAALYRAKELGKDCVAAHAPDLVALAGRRQASLLGRTARGGRTAASGRVTADG